MKNPASPGAAGKPKESNWEVYIIQTKTGTLYTGITTDIERRFQAHRGNGPGAKFFNISGPKKIVFRETHPDRSLASRRESEIKKMSRSEKLMLIKQSRRGKTAVDS